MKTRVIVYVGCALQKDTQRRREVSVGKSRLHHAHWAMPPEVRLHLPREVPFSYCTKVLYGVGLALAHWPSQRQTFQSSVKTVEKETGLTWLGFGKGCFTVSGDTHSSEG